MRGFHWAECGRLDLLQSDAEIGRLAALAFRIAVEAGFEECMRLDAAGNDGKISDGAANAAAYDSLDYAAVFLQVTHESDRDDGEHFRRCLTALYLIQLLDSAGFFPPGKDADIFSPNLKSPGLVIASILVKHLESWLANVES